MPSRLSTPRPPSRPSSIAVVGADDAVHRRGEQRQLEAVRAEGPGDVDVVGVARPPRGHDRDVVEPVGPPALLASTDLDFHPIQLLRMRRPRLSPLADEKSPSERGLKAAICGARPGNSKVLAMITAVNRRSRSSCRAGRQARCTSTRAQRRSTSTRVEGAGAEVLRRLGAAGDAVGEAIPRRGPLVARRDIARRGTRLPSRPPRSARAARSDLVAAAVGSPADDRRAPAWAGDDRLAGAHLDQPGQAQHAVVRRR